MKLLRSFVIAFSMFSKIPMPKVEWNKENMKYSMCFFPWVGALIGALALFIQWLCEVFGIENFLRSALLCVLPVLVTGGIHMDGFCDTADALSSYQNREKKLEILKDSHIGAFAVLYSIVYFILYAGVLSELDSMKSVGILLVGFILSRSLSGLALVTFKSAKDSGTLYTFTSASHKGIVFGVLLLYIALCFAVIGFLSPVTAGITLLFGGLVFLYYRIMSYRQFGGITGDVAGYFLQIFELVFAFAVLIGMKLEMIL